jgi:hypothetical protein
MAQLLGPNGSPLRSVQEQKEMMIRNIRAKYDAAQTLTSNELHWQNADHLDPHAAASFSVRKKLRSRSRYECGENNPYLQGTLLAIANDFVGTGVKVHITDKRLTKSRRQTIKQKFEEWMRVRKIRNKLWRMRLRKIVDGESFLKAVNKKDRSYPIKLDFFLIECDQVTTEYGTTAIHEFELGKKTGNHVDGVRFDYYNNPEAYHILRVHPGANSSFAVSSYEGDWFSSKVVIHWFRKDRNWLRGIPETVASLPLCSVLRRYTLATLRHRETAADLSLIIESEGPGAASIWNDSAGGLIDDDPFGTFPLEAGTIMNMPWGYKGSQLNPVPIGEDYDEYVGSILREIIRPLLVPFNVAAGTSKDSNMASSIVDKDMYRDGQAAERNDCTDEVLTPIFQLWWEEARLIPGYLGDDDLASDPQWKYAPSFRPQWDTIGADHTDPTKVANSIDTLYQSGHILDQDIQERYFNRSEEEWREQLEEQKKYRKKLQEKFGIDEEKPDDKKPASPTKSSVPSSDEED